MKERELDITKLCYAICRQWRKLLIAAVIGCIWIGGLGNYRDYKTYQQNVQNNSVEIELSVESKEAIDHYLECQEIYQKQQIYNKNSIWMQLDPTGFYKGELIYYGDKYDIDFLRKLLVENNILNEENEMYFDELVDDENLYNQTMNGITNNIILLKETENQQEGKNVINVWAQDEKSCNQILELMLIEMQDVEYLTSVSLVADNRLLKFQELNFNTENQYKDDIELLKNALWNKELAFIEGKLSNSPATQEDWSVSLKWFAVGAVTGILIMACWSFLKIATSKKLQQVDDFEYLFGIPCLGYVSENKSKKWGNKIDYFVDRAFSISYEEKDDVLDIAITRIKVWSKQHQINKVFISGDIENAWKQEVVDQIKEQLEKEGLSIYVENSITNSGSAMQTCAEVGNVVFVESVNESLYQMIMKRIAFTKENKICVLGAIVFE